MNGPVISISPFSNGVAGVPFGTGQVKGIVMRLRNDGTGPVSLKLTLLPSTVMPLIVFGLAACKIRRALEHLEEPGRRGRQRPASNMRSNVS